MSVANPNTVPLLLGFATLIPTYKLAVRRILARFAMTGLIQVLLLRIQFRTMLG